MEPYFWKKARADATARTRRRARDEARDEDVSRGTALGLPRLRGAGDCTGGARFGVGNSVGFVWARTEARAVVTDSTLGFGPSGSTTGLGLLVSSAQLASTSSDAAMAMR